MDRRTRVCVIIIVAGLANFVAYTAGWALIGGDAMNGYVHREAAGGAARHYFLTRHGTEVREVSAAAWVYSAVHAISVPLTVGAVLLAMLTLARDRLIAAMHATLVRGRAFMTALAVVIGALMVIISAYFTWYTITQLVSPPLASGGGGV
ncbi:MAG: hypothetical protein ACOC95_05400 [Planctomycetota bacterium]